MCNEMVRNMKKFMFAVMLLGTVIFFNCNAQEKSEDNISEGEVVTHNVAMGETVMLISKKYLVKPQDIYELNPTAVNGITPNSVLRIPMDKSLRKKVSAVEVKDKPKISILKTGPGSIAAH